MVTQGSMERTWTSVNGVTETRKSPQAYDVSVTVYTYCPKVWIRPFLLSIYEDLTFTHHHMVQSMYKCRRYRLAASAVSFTTPSMALVSPLPNSFRQLATNSLEERRSTRLRWIPSMGHITLDLWKCQAFSAMGRYAGGILLSLLGHITTKQ